MRIKQENVRKCLMYSRYTINVSFELLVIPTDLRNTMHGQNTLLRIGAKKINNKASAHEELSV